MLDWLRTSDYRIVLWPLVSLVVLVIVYSTIFVWLMAAEGHGFDDVLTYYRHLIEHLRWQDLGQVLAGGNRNAGDIAGKPELEQAYQLGLSIR